MKQLSFDDFINNRIEVGDWVEITARPDENQNVEDYYYLQDYTGKKGEVVRIIKGRKVVSFEVDFHNGNNIGIFYEKEITKIGGIENEKTIRKTKRKNKRNNVKK